MVRFTVMMTSVLRPRRLLRVAMLAILGLTTGLAAAAGDARGHVKVDIADQASLQRGARNFVSYCMGCHSAQYVRYNRLGQDLQIPGDQLVKELMFAAQKPQETMTIAMRPADAERWFGTMPPDLSLIARSKGANYLYAFLRGFYVDPARPTGVNNIMLDSVAMPHVLWELQGAQEAVFEVNDGQKVFREFRQLTPGKLSAEEYDGFVRDLVNFLAYVGEPMQLERQRLGLWVLGFLLVFGILAYLLKQEIWKDIK